MCLATLPSHVFLLPLQGLAGELGPFICSGSHVIQKDSHPSAIHTFVEAMCQCVPNIPVRPCVLKVRVKAASDSPFITNSDIYIYTYLGLILGLRPANERRRYFVTTSLIGWAQTLLLLIALLSLIQIYVSRADSRFAPSQ